MSNAEYLNSIFARRAEARSVDFRAVAFCDGARPAIAQCHANVDRWIREHPVDAAVRGWLIISCSPFNCLLGSHSIVRSSSNELFDLTPVTEGQRRVPFLPHAGSTESFEPFLDLEFRSLIWPPVSAEDLDLIG
ncbi:MAG: hypothetical protein V4527_15000 [Pseudomonadota bacterium]